MAMSDAAFAKFLERESYELRQWQMDLRAKLADARKDAWFKKHEIADLQKRNEVLEKQLEYELKSQQEEAKPSDKTEKSPVPSWCAPIPEKKYDAYDVKMLERSVNWLKECLNEQENDALPLREQGKNFAVIYEDLKYEKEQVRDLKKQVKALRKRNWKTTMKKIQKTRSRAMKKRIIADAKKRNNKIE
uniref:Uncharacterized protein n=1 Tax=Caenorhabditis japonica TaxID=281687 RepID=A0A8R1HV78_CAEJA